MTDVERAQRGLGYIRQGERLARRHASTAHRDAVVAAHPLMMGIGPYVLSYMRLRLLHPEMSHEDAAIRAWDQGIETTTKVLALVAPGAAQDPREFLDAEVDPLLNLLKQVGPVEFLARWTEAHGGPLGMAYWPEGHQAAMRLPQDIEADIRQGSQRVAASFERTTQKMLQPPKFPWE